MKPNGNQIWLLDVVCNLMLITEQNCVQHIRYSKVYIAISYFKH